MKVCLHSVSYSGTVTPDQAVLTLEDFMMRWLRKLRRLPSTDHHRLLVQSVLLVSSIRMALWLMPFRTLRRLLRWMSRAKVESPVADEEDTSRMAWAVTTASRYIPGARCLARALAMQVLLVRRGHTARLRIGVLKDEVGQLQAHAWVESHGRIVIGGIGDLARYTPLPLCEQDGITAMKWSGFQG